MEETQKKNLIEQLNTANAAYYNGEEIMSNKEWDRLFNELKNLEDLTGIIFPDSPTQHVGAPIIKGLAESVHEFPALSLDKTQDMNDYINMFEKLMRPSNHNVVLMWKMDGSTVQATYTHGRLQKLVTRGDGEVGHLITHNAHNIHGLPINIPYTGKLVVRGEVVMSYREFNRIQMEDGGIQNNQKDYTYQQLQLVIEPIKDWRIIAEGNVNSITNFQHWEVLPVYAHAANGDPFAFSWDGRAVGSTTVSEYGYKENFLTTNIYSDYSKQLESGHYFKVMGGFNAELMKTRSLTATGDGLITPSVPTISTTTTNPRVGGGYAHWSTAGFFGRLNYNYKERYMVEANVRYDGTSRFVGDERWGVFPSFSLGWNIAREDFFTDFTDEVSTLKLRGSWGQLGNMNTKAWYPFYQSMPV